jgi:hypothetical protein
MAIMVIVILVGLVALLAYLLHKCETTPHNDNQEVNIDDFYDN